MTADDIRITFAMDEATSLLLETGFSKPICELTLSDKSLLRSSLLDYHCMLKVKACMKQYMEGLNELGILDMIKKHPEAMKPLFVFEKQVLTSGILFWFLTILNLLQDH